MTIPVAHDFNCGWCWIGMLQVLELKREFGVHIEWLGYELMPEELDWPDPLPLPEIVSNRPKTPTRMDLAWAAQGIEKPAVIRPKKMRTHNAHETVELAKEHGVADEVVERIYRALWERGENIDEPAVLLALTAGLLDPNELCAALAERRYQDRIVGFNDAAHANGVYNLPTFWIGQERYAEQPLAVLRKAFAAAK